MEPKVTLISWTQRPIETLNAIWASSRSNDPVPLNNCDPDLFQKVIDSKIPVAEMIDFIFLLQDVSIAFREQMVRHRIGVKVDPRIGVDIVPDLADSVWWSQSMRILDMSKFAEDGHYEIPKSVRVAGPLAVEFYASAMMECQITYRMLADFGVPLEDARMVIPLAATHRIAWKLNLSALMHIVGKRGCWILQLGFWEPIIRGMIEELTTRVHPLFRELVRPPCLDCKSCFQGCLFRLDNERRIEGEDEIPPCPLFLYWHHQDALDASSVPILDRPSKDRWGFHTTFGWQSSNLVKSFRMEAMRKAYAELWRRNVDTGEPHHDAPTES